MLYFFLSQQVDITRQYYANYVLAVTYNYKRHNYTRMMIIMMMMMMMIMMMIMMMMMMMMMVIIIIIIISRQQKKGRKIWCYLTTDSTHFIYGFMATELW